MDSRAEVSQAIAGSDDVSNGWRLSVETSLGGPTEPGALTRGRQYRRVVTQCGRPLEESLRAKPRPTGRSVSSKSLMRRVVSRPGPPGRENELRDKADDNRRPSEIPGRPRGGEIVPRRAGGGTPAAHRPAREQLRITYVFSFAAETMTMKSYAFFDILCRSALGGLLLKTFFVAASLQAQGTLNLVQNGSFEVITVVPGVETRARPWQGELSYNEGWSNAPHGRNYAHIGGVFQDVSTTPSQLYHLTFWAASDLYINATGTVAVRWAGQDAAVLVTEPHPYDPMRNRSEQIVWQQFQISALAATAPLTRLEFRASNNSQILLDDVRLQVIPEAPSGMLLALGGAIFLCRWAIRVIESESGSREDCPPAPPTPPDMRVRIRRFRSD